MMLFLMGYAMGCGVGAAAFWLYTNQSAKDKLRSIFTPKDKP